MNLLARLRQTKDRNREEDGQAGGSGSTTPPPSPKAIFRSPRAIVGGTALGNPFPTFSASVMGNLFPGMFSSADPHVAQTHLRQHAAEQSNKEWTEEIIKQISNASSSSSLLSMHTATGLDDANSTTDMKTSSFTTVLYTKDGQPTKYIPSFDMYKSFNPAPQGSLSPSVIDELRIKQVKEALYTEYDFFDKRCVKLPSEFLKSIQESYLRLQYFGEYYSDQDSVTSEQPDTLVSPLLRRYVPLETPAYQGILFGDVGRRVLDHINNQNGKLLFRSLDGRFTSGDKIRKNRFSTKKYLNILDRELHDDPFHKPVSTLSAMSMVVHATPLSNSSVRKIKPLKGKNTATEKKNNKKKKKKSEIELPKDYAKTAHCTLSVIDPSESFSFCNLEFSSIDAQDFPPLSNDADPKSSQKEYLRILNGAKRGFLQHKYMFFDQPKKNESFALEFDSNISKYRVVTVHDKNKAAKLRRARAIATNCTKSLKKNLFEPVSKEWEKVLCRKSNTQSQLAANSSDAVMTPLFIGRPSLRRDLPKFTIQSPPPEDYLLKMRYYMTKLLLYVYFDMALHPNAQDPYTDTSSVLGYVCLNNIFSSNQATKISVADYHTLDSTSREMIHIIQSMIEDTAEIYFEQDGFALLKINVPILRRIWNSAVLTPNNKMGLIRRLASEFFNSAHHCTALICTEGKELEYRPYNESVKGNVHGGLGMVLRLKTSKYASIVEVLKEVKDSPSIGTSTGAVAMVKRGTGVNDGAILKDGTTVREEAMVKENTSVKEETTAENDTSFKENIIANDEPNENIMTTLELTTKDPKNAEDIANSHIQGVMDTLQMDKRLQDANVSESSLSISDSRALVVAKTSLQLNSLEVIPKVPEADVSPHPFVSFGEVDLITSNGNNLPDPVILSLLMNQNVSEAPDITTFSNLLRSLEEIAPEVREVDTLSVSLVSSSEIVNEMALVSLDRPALSETLVTLEEETTVFTRDTKSPSPPLVITDENDEEITEANSVLDPSEMPDIHFIEEDKEATEDEVLPAEAHAEPSTGSVEVPKAHIPPYVEVPKAHSHPDVDSKTYSFKNKSASRLSPEESADDHRTTYPKPFPNPYPSKISTRIPLGPSATDHIAMLALNYFVDYDAYTEYCLGKLAERLKETSGHSSYPPVIEGTHSELSEGLAGFLANRDLMRHQSLDWLSEEMKPKLFEKLAKIAIKIPCWTYHAEYRAIRHFNKFALYYLQHKKDLELKAKVITLLGYDKTTMPPVPGHGGACANSTNEAPPVIDSPYDAESTIIMEVILDMLASISHGFPMIDAPVKSVALYYVVVSYREERRKELEAQGSQASLPNDLKAQAHIEALEFNKETSEAVLNAESSIGTDLNIPTKQTDPTSSRSNAHSPVASHSDDALLHSVDPADGSASAPPVPETEKKKKKKKKKKERGYHKMKDMDHKGFKNCPIQEDEWTCDFCYYELFYGDTKTLLKSLNKRKKLLHSRKKVKERLDGIGQRGGKP